MQRRAFLILGAGGLLGRAVGRNTGGSVDGAAGPAPAYSVVPVVGDGHWIWTKPPDGPTGYLDTRSFRTQIDIELRGHGQAANLVATTVLPIACPEQQIEQEQVLGNGCLATIRAVGECARQLVLQTPQLAAGQVVRATWKAVVRLSKQYHAYSQESFPQRQVVPADVRRLYLGDSPGIQTRIPEVRTVLAELSEGVEHPWEQAARFANWTRRNIKPQPGRFTSVQCALTSRRGDCEEMSAVFVALCRAAGIPARLVWVPNHNWAEFFLTDEQGTGHWIPAHTACYHWFGWTGAHELVLQKGDRLRVPQRAGLFRLLEDWMLWMGKRPAVEYQAEMTPLPPSPGEDAGPGARRKLPTGEWQLAGNHAMDRYLRR